MSEALRQVVWKCDRCGGDAQAIFGIFPSCKCGSTSFKAAQPPAPTAQHQQGCEALGGYGNGIGPCSCGAAQPVQQPTADGGMAYHMGRGAYECSVLPARGNQVKAFGELTSIQQAEWVAKAAVHAALSQPVQQPTDQWECAAKGSGPCQIGPHGPAGSLQCAYCGEAPDALVQPVQQPGAEPDGRLHADGYFTWKRRDGYVLDAKLPCDFYLAAPAQRQPLTVPALTDAQMSECAWGYVADSRNLDAGVTGIIQATQLACAAAWGVTLAAQKGEKL